MSNEERVIGMRPELVAPYGQQEPDSPLAARLLDPGQIAQIAHEVNRAYCESIGDDSQVPWADAPKWQKDSATNGVMFMVNNPDATPEDSHNAWLEEKHQQGWKFGPEKDAEKKEHPCFLPYGALPLEQRVKDKLFQGVVRACLKL